MAAGQPVADHLCGRPLPRRRPEPRHRELAEDGRALAGPARHQRRPRRAGGRLALTPHRQDRAPCAAREPLFDPSSDLQDPRRCEAHRLAAHARARHVFRGRRRALLYRIAGSGIDADPADCGLRRERGVAHRRAAIRLGHLAAARRQDPGDRLYPTGRRGRCRLLCTRPLPQSGDPQRPADPTDTTPPTFRGSWESAAFITLLRNALAWGAGA